MSNRNQFLRGGIRLSMTSAVVGIALLSVAPAAKAQSVYVGQQTLLLTGLNNPRHLAVAPDGSVYVTEAGSGGTGSAVTDPTGAILNYGTTSAITRYLSGVTNTAGNFTPNRVLVNAPSLADQRATVNGMPNTPGSGATGIQDIAFVGNQAYGIIGYGADLSQASNQIANAFTTAEKNSGATLFGKVVSLSLTGNNAITAVGDVAAYQAANVLPSVPKKESNPYGFAALGDGNVLVVDAGSNDLLKVNTTNGNVSLLTQFAPRTNPSGIGGPVYNSVPTAVHVGPDGNYYISELTGFPYLSGAANIWQYNPTTSTLTQKYTGFTNLVDFTFAGGYLYALQIDTNGLASQSGPGPSVLYRVNTTTGQKDKVNGLDNLFFATGVTSDTSGSLYVTNLGTTPGAGQLIKVNVVAAPEASSVALLAMGGIFALMGHGVMRLRTRRNG